MNDASPGPAAPAEPRPRVQLDLLVLSATVILLILLGVYLLSRRLFSDRWTAFIVSFSAVCGTVWYWQLFFNFRIFHMLPLALYFLFRFTAERRPEFFWMMGLTVLLGTLGCPPY